MVRYLSYSLSSEYMGSWSISEVDGETNLLSTIHQKLHYIYKFTWIYYQLIREMEWLKGKVAGNYWCYTIISQCGFLPFPSTKSRNVWKWKPMLPTVGYGSTLGNSFQMLGCFIQDGSFELVEQVISWPSLMLSGTKWLPCHFVLKRVQKTFSAPQMVISREDSGMQASPQFMTPQ